MNTTVLLVEDSPSLAAIYARFVESFGCRVVQAGCGAEARERLADATPQVMLLDLHLPDCHGLDLLRELQTLQVDVTIIVITAHGGVDTAVEAMRFGAFDFLVKPFDAKRLTVTLRNALSQRTLEHTVDRYKARYERDQFCGFVGAAECMQGVYRVIENAAPSKATVFITGESGTGKEVCAEAIHTQSPRRDKPFVAINCAAIPRDLMESEIFGHVKGAFTGALSKRDGAAARADGGTLFLDEVCEMDLDLQSKLLRFVQTGTFQRVGGSGLERVDVRFICATNRDPYTEVEQGRFREDLYYRLHVVPVRLPPLRERADDALLIWRRLLSEYVAEEGKDFETFDPEVEASLAAYEWPGNVRELQNVVRNIVVLNNGKSVTQEMLPEQIRFRNGGARRPNPARGGPQSRPRMIPDREPSSAQLAVGELIRPLAEVERQIIEHAISTCNGNIPRAAARLEISPSTIYRKLQVWDKM